MRGLFGKVMVIIAGVAAIFGISTSNVTASPSSVSAISSKSALFLEHGKQISNSIGIESWHSSHASHMSHESHVSHVSHSSGY